MRVLSVRQKKAIDKIMDDNHDIKESSDLSITDYSRIDAMNPHETFWCDVDRYMRDKYIDRIYKHTR